MHPRKSTIIHLMCTSAHQKGKWHVIACKKQNHVKMRQNFIGTYILAWLWLKISQMVHNHFLLVTVMKCCDIVYFCLTGQQFSRLLCEWNNIGILAKSSELKQWQNVLMYIFIFLWKVQAMHPFACDFQNSRILS